MLVVGAGGLGAPVLLYLGAAGVGTLGIVDDDKVALSNLQRQVIHGTTEIGTPKVDSASAAIRRLNPHVAVERHEHDGSMPITRWIWSPDTISSRTSSDEFHHALSVVRRVLLRQASAWSPPRSARSTVR